MKKTVMFLLDLIVSAAFDTGPPWSHRTIGGLI